MQQQTEAAQPQTMDVAVKPPAERAALALKSSKTETDLAALVAKSADIVAIIDAAGRQQGHQMGMELKNARIAVEKTGKAATEDAVAFHKAVIAESKRLVALVTPEETRIFGLRDAYDEKVAAEKAEADRIKAERKATIRAAIDQLRTTPSRFVGGKSDDIALMLEALAGKVIDASEFAEFVDDAQAALDYAGNELNGMYQAAKQREDAERDRLIAIEEEQKRMAAQAEANRKEEARLADLRRESELAEAERKRVAAAEAAAQQKLIDDAKAEQARIAAEAQAKLDAQAAQIERQRVEAEQAQKVAAAELAARVAAFEAQQAAAARTAQDAVDKAEAELLAAAEAAKPKAEPVAETFPGVNIDAAHEPAPLKITPAESLDTLARREAEEALRDAVRGLLELDAMPEMILALVNEELTVTA